MYVYSLSVLAEAGVLLQQFGFPMVQFQSNLA